MKHINELKKTKKLLRIVLPFLAIAGCHTVSSVAMDTVGLQANSFELSPENQPAVFHILSNSMPKRYAVPLWIGKANQALVNTKAIKVSVGHPNHSDQVSLEWCTSRGKRSSYALILNGDAGANRGILREQETKSHRATLNSNETSEIKAWSQQLTREVMSTIHTSLKDACKNGIQWPCLDKLFLESTYSLQINRDNSLDWVVENQEFSVLLNFTVTEDNKSLLQKIKSRHDHVLRDIPIGNSIPIPLSPQTVGLLKALSAPRSQQSCDQSVVQMEANTADSTPPATARGYDSDDSIRTSSDLAFPISSHLQGVTVNSATNPASTHGYIPPVNISTHRSAPLQAWTEAQNTSSAAANLCIPVPMAGVNNFMLAGMMPVVYMVPVYPISTDITPAQTPSAPADVGTQLRDRLCSILDMLSNTTSDDYQKKLIFQANQVLFNQRGLPLKIIQGRHAKFGHVISYKWFEVENTYFVLTINPEVCLLEGHTRVRKRDQSTRTVAFKLTNGDNEELIKQLNDWSNRFKPVISDIHDTLERIFTLEKMGQIWQPGARFELRVYSDNMLGFASIINGEESIVNFAIRRDGTYSIKSIDESTRGEVHNSVPLNLTSQLSNVRLGAALIHALNATLQIHPQSFSTAASSSTQKQTTAEVGGSVAMGSASSSSGGEGFRKVAWAE